MDLNSRLQIQMMYFINSELSVELHFKYLGKRSTSVP